jgi:hypothetical protein
MINTPSLMSSTRQCSASTEFSRFVDESKIDAAKASRERVQELAQRGGLFVSPVHDNTFVRSMTADGESAPGSGDAVVTSV